MSLRPVSSEKHYVILGPTTIAAGVVLKSDIARSVTLSAANAATEVPIGAHVKAVFIELWVSSDTSTTNFSQVDLMVAKPKSSELTSMTHATMLLPNALPFKNVIFLRSKGNVQSKTDAGFIPFLRGWIKIPRSHQRFAQDDVLALAMAGTTGAILVCGVITYKYTY